MVFPSRGLRPRLRLIRPRREPSSRSSPGHIDVGGSFPAPGREHLVQRQDTLAHHAQSVLRDLEEGPPRGIFREPDVFCSGGEVHARGGDGIRSESDAEARAEGIVGVVPRALHDVFSEFEHAEIVEDELVWVFDVDAEAELAERVSLGADEILLDVLVLLAEMVEGFERGASASAGHAVEDVNDLAESSRALLELAREEYHRGGDALDVELGQGSLRVKAVEQHLARARHRLLGAEQHRRLLDEFAPVHLEAELRLLVHARAARGGVGDLIVRQVEGVVVGGELLHRDDQRERRRHPPPRRGGERETASPPRGESRGTTSGVSSYARGGRPAPRARCAAVTRDEPPRRTLAQRERGHSLPSKRRRNTRVCDRCPAGCRRWKPSIPDHCVLTCL